MELIQNLGELGENLSKLEHYMNSEDAYEKDFHRDLVKKGICFVVYQKGNNYIFAPSRFVGYKNNDMNSHINNDLKDGRETTKVINDLIGVQCRLDKEFDKIYRKFCDELGFDAKEKGSFGVVRRFWNI